MNIPHALATQLSRSASLSAEERLFQQALSQVESKASEGGKRPALFDILQHAQTVGDVAYVLELARKSNKLWSEDVGKSWLKSLCMIAEQILLYKGLFSSVTARIGDDFASPIWGSLEFVLSVFKDLASTALKLEDVESTLRFSIERFSRYFANGKSVSSGVQNALVKYYEIVISFAVETHEEFQASRTRSMFNAVHRTLHSKLTELKDRIHHAIDDVDKGAYLDQFESIQSQMKALNGTFGLALVQQASGRSTSQPLATRAIHNLPNLNKQFSGRQDYISRIQKSFQKQNGGQACTAVYGLGGIGKTQLIQRYAHEQFKAGARRIVVYVDASSPTSINADVLTFMQSHAPDLLVTSASGKQSLGQFHAWLSSQDDWLLVLDNVKEYDDVRGVIPRGHSGQLLFSTREALLAAILAPENIMEVSPMTKLESRTLIAKLAAYSTLDEDKTECTHELVVDFAKGMPLYIEQVIHNAIFSRKSIRTTLSQVAEKTALLRQKNVSSLHEDNLSLGGMIMQAFESIRARSEKAAALFCILAYFDPSAIPIQLIREGSTGYHTFLTNRHAYDRGARRIATGNSQASVETRSQNSTTLEPNARSKASSRFKVWSSKFVRSTVETSRDDLPVDDASLREAVSATCGPNTPYGRLFENEDTIDSALVTLYNAAVVVTINPDTLWMHDLVSEVARALIESESYMVSQHVLLTSSILVYISLPHPETLYMWSNLQVSKKYLPHALACHRELKRSGLLNDSSIGPELSHLIASTLTKNLTREFQVSGRHCTQEEVAYHDERILDYYQQAYDGYMAGWTRLKSHHAITDEQIRALIIKDRNMEVALNRYFKGEEYSRQTDRFGHTAPWRAIQTAARLYVHLDQNMQRHSEAEYWLRIVLNFCEAVFGPLDEETEYFRSCMIQLYGHGKGDFESAYNLNLEPIARILKCKTSRLASNFLGKVDFALLLQTAHGLEYIATAGSCALNQARSCRNKNDHIGKVKWAKIALFWFGIRLRETKAFHGESLYVLSAEMKDHAHAYELCEEPRTSMYYFAQAIVCTFDTTGPLAELCGPAPSIKFDNIQLYEDAKVRLYGESEVASNTAWDGDPELKELIGLCDVQAKIWKDSCQPSAEKEREVEEKVDWDAILAQPFDEEFCTSK